MIKQKCYLAQFFYMYWQFLYLIYIEEFSSLTANSLLFPTLIRYHDQPTSLPPNSCCCHTASQSWHFTAWLLQLPYVWFFPKKHQKLQIGSVQSSHELHQRVTLHFFCSNTTAVPSHITFTAKYCYTLLYPRTLTISSISPYPPAPSDSLHLSSSLYPLFVLLLWGHIIQLLDKWVRMLPHMIHPSLVGC